MDLAYYCIPIEFGTPEYDETVRLRYDILRKPLNKSFEEHDLALEYDAIHIACYEVRTMELVGCLILKPAVDGSIKMRQVAIADNVQRKGVGTIMVRYAEAFASKFGFEKMELHARITAVDFYIKNHYSKQGEVFQEVGIDHYYMFKMLNGQ